jgi:hypothetical protein
MDQRTLPPPRLAPLPPETTPELKEHFDATQKRMGFVPNSMLIMQRDPNLARAYAVLSGAIWNPRARSI